MKHKKQILKTILLLLLPAFVVAQDYQPIPDSNAAWIMQEDDGYGGHYFHRLFLSPTKDDTIINSLSFIKLFFRFSIGDSLYNGAFRNGNNGKSYYVPKYSQQEHLLRDFTKNSGDTIKNVSYNITWDEVWVLDFFVDSVEFVNSGPYTYKVMYLKTVVEDTIPNVSPDDLLVWMEKIGSFGGGILNSRMGALGAHRLYCMQFNDTIYYNSNFWSFLTEDITYEYGECADPVGINEGKLSKLEIKINPNPFENSFTISNLSGNYPLELSIYNQFGYCILKKTIFNNQTIQTIELNALLPKGVYFLKIQTNDNLLFTQKIIKK